MQEADELIGRLRSLAVAISEPLWMILPRLGRWDQAMTRREQYELTLRIGEELHKIGISQAAIDNAKSDIRKWTTIDLMRPIVEGVHSIIQKKVEERQRAIDAFPQPIVDLNGYNSAIESWREASSAGEDIISMQLKEPTLIPTALRSFLLECQIFTQEERNDLISKYKEELDDLEYYARHHGFRRMEVWLASDPKLRSEPFTEN
jgi:hypothetical protein